MDPERPRNPQRLRRDPVHAAVVAQIFAWDTGPHTPATLDRVATRLTAAPIPPRRGTPRGHVASGRGSRGSPVSMGTASSGRTRPAPARVRPSAWRPVGPGPTRRPAPPEDGRPLPVPAIVSEETCAAVQARFARKTHRARRHNSAHESWRRGLVSCGPGQMSCLGRPLPMGSHEDLGRGRTDALRAAHGPRCPARVAPTRTLEALVRQDLGRILTDPARLTHELARAHGGAWLPQARQARRKTRRAALTQLARQQARWREVDRAELIGRDACERTRPEVTPPPYGSSHQRRQLDAPAQPQVHLAALAQGREACGRTVQPPVDQRTCAQRRQLGALLIDRVMVTNDPVEMRYVVPTWRKGTMRPLAWQITTVELGHYPFPGSVSVRISCSTAPRGLWANRDTTL